MSNQTTEHPLVTLAEAQALLNQHAQTWSRRGSDEYPAIVRGHLEDFRLAALYDQLHVASVIQWRHSPTFGWVLWLFHTDLSAVGILYLGGPGA